MQNEPNCGESARDPGVGYAKQTQFGWPYCHGRMDRPRKTNPISTGRATGPGGPVVQTNPIWRLHQREVRDVRYKQSQFRRVRPGTGGRLRETKPIHRDGAQRRETWGSSLVPRHSGLWPSPGQSQTNPISTGWAAGPGGQLYKQTQFGGRRHQPAREARGRIVSNKANFRRSRYPTIPLCHHSRVPVPRLSRETKPVSGQTGPTGPVPVIGRYSPCRRDRARRHAPARQRRGADACPVRNRPATCSAASPARPGRPAPARSICRF